MEAGGARPAPDRTRSPTLESSAIPTAPDQTLDYTRALVDATCAIAASAARHADAPIEALLEQVCRLLPVEATVLLTVPGADDLVECQPAPTRLSALFRASAGEPDRVDALARAAIARGGAQLAGDPAAELAAPLVADGEVLGALHAHWCGRPPPSSLEVELVCALARHAGLAICAARQRAAAAAARAQSEAVYGALSDAVLVFGRDGGLIESNRAGREWIRAAGCCADGPAAVTARALKLAGRARRGDDRPRPTSLVDRALAGRSASAELLWTTPSGAERRLHVVATPVRDPYGRVRAAAVIARDVTEFYQAVSGRARFDGAVKTARRISHELGNQLAPVLGYAELLAGTLEGEEAEFAGRIVDAAVASANTLSRLQRIIRFEQTEFGGEVMLDLDAAIVERPDST
jgi:PAS domain-containing protein